jgi:hypothetical protein
MLLDILHDKIFDNIPDILPDNILEIFILALTDNIHHFLTILLTLFHTPSLDNPGTLFDDILDNLPDTSPTTFLKIFLTILLIIFLPILLM